MQMQGRLAVLQREWLLMGEEKARAVLRSSQLSLAWDGESGHLADVTT